MSDFEKSLLRFALAGVLGACASFGNVAEAEDVMNKKPEKPAYCAGKVSIEVSRRHPVPDQVSYFIRAAPGTRQVGYSSRTQNFILNMDSGKVVQTIGFYDPVLSPDGKILTVPSQRILMQSGLKPRLYDEAKDTDVRYEVSPTETVMPLGSDGKPRSFADIVKSNEKYVKRGLVFLKPNDQGSYSPAEVDPDIPSSYQSVGRLRTSANSSGYRVLFESDDSKMRYRDYDLDHKTGELRFSGPVKNVCGVNTLSAALPMLSKTGTEFSIYNPDAQETQIYEINSKTDSCAKKETFPLLVGKIDFSPSSRKLAFHIDQSESPSQKDYFQFPRSYNHFGVFIYDRERKNLYPLATREDENAYYPTFLSEDEIAFVTSTKSEPPQFHINLARITSPKGIDCAECMSGAKNQLAAFIGHLMNERCQAREKSFRHGWLSFSHLSPEQCFSLLETYSEDDLKKALSIVKGPGWKLSELANISKSALTAICHSSPAAPSTDAAPSTQK